MNKVIEASSSLSYTSPSQPGPALKRIRRNSSTGFWIFLFLLPFLLLFIAFTLWPLVATVVYSLFDWNGIDALSSQNFVGLGN